MAECGDLDSGSWRLRNCPRRGNAWAPGKLFEAAATHADPSARATSAQVKDGLYGPKDQTLDGLAPPRNFVNDQPSVTPC